MTYRARHADDRFATPRANVPERDLPEPCRAAFDQFERYLEQHVQQRPVYLEIPLGEVQEVYFPE